MEKKDIAISFLRMSSSGQVEEAYPKYVGTEFKHHNPYYRGDAASLSAGMKESAITMPDKILEVQRAIQEGDLVAVHSKVTISPEMQMALVHIFRFSDDRIVEPWDIGQQVPEDSPNEFGMF